MADPSNEEDVVRIRITETQSAFIVQDVETGKELGFRRTPEGVRLFHPRGDEIDMNLEAIARVMAWLGRAL